MARILTKDHRISLWVIPFCSMASCSYRGFFNLFNKGNVAAVQSLDGTSPVFGSTLQRLPGREGQVGIRFEF